MWLIYQTQRRKAVAEVRQGCNYDPYTLPSVSFVGGSTQDFMFHAYFHSLNAPIDLSSCTADFSIINASNKNGICLSKPMTITEGDKTESGVVSNYLYVRLEPADTVDLYGKYIYQITVRSVTGVVEIPDQGILYISNNINKALVR